MYSMDFRLAALRLLDFFGSMRKTVRALKVGVSTISRWSRRLEPRRRSPAKGGTLAQHVRDFVFTALSASPCLTSLELCGRIKTALGVTVSRSLVLNVVRSLGFSYKRVKKRALVATGCKTSPNCHAFRSLLRSEQGTGRVIVSIDESGFDHRALPFYG
jgi:transposase